MTSIAAASSDGAHIRQMGTGIGFTVAAAAVVALIVAFGVLSARYRGKRIVTCPETRLPVSAEINAMLAAGTAIVTQPRFVVTNCSRWPERAGCDQACAPQLAASPEETLVRNIVARWYAERACVYCAQPIRSISGALIVPALLTAAGELREWKDIAPEDLPQVLASAVAVCARCELAEDFRRRFPNRVTDRPVTPLREHAAVPRHLVVEPPSQAVY
ncbi:MAG TPA: hypothetical protein VFN10_01620 [Thermoanaerobaculia bacterium]|nr:hypothetical protein [Thermoanaerobaculia bacterium]